MPGKGKQRRGKKKHQRTIKNVQKFREKKKQLEEEQVSYVQAEVKKLQEQLADRHQQEVSQLESRLAAVELEKTEEDILKEEKEKVLSSFEREEAKIRDEEAAEDIRYQQRVAKIKEIPSEHNKITQVRVSITSSPPSTDTQPREMCFKCGGSDAVNSILSACVSIISVSGELQLGDCKVLQLDGTQKEQDVELWDTIEDLKRNPEGWVVLHVKIPADSAEADGADEPKLTLHAAGSVSDTSALKSGAKGEANSAEEEKEDEDEEGKGEGDQSEGDDEETASAYQKSLKERSDQTIWEQKNKIQAKHEEELKNLEENKKKASKKYSRVRQYLSQFQDESKGRLETLRKRLQEKVAKMKVEFEASIEYVSISLRLPEELTVSYNGEKTKLRIDTITTVEQVIHEVHLKFNIALSTFSYLQDNQKSPTTILAPTCTEKIAALYFGQKYVQLSLRVPEEEHRSAHLKNIRDLEEEDFTEKAMLLKKKVESKEVILKDDIPWPSFLQAVLKYQKVTFFQVYNVFNDDPPEYIKQSKNKKLLWWHPDKVLWKNSVLHEEDSLIINEWHKEVNEKQNKFKSDLSVWLETSTTTWHPSY